MLTEPATPSANAATTPMRTALPAYKRLETLRIETPFSVRARAGRERPGDGHRCDPTGIVSAHIAKITPLVRRKTSDTLAHFWFCSAGVRHWRSSEAVSGCRPGGLSQSPPVQKSGLRVNNNTVAGPRP